MGNKPHATKSASADEGSKVSLEASRLAMMRLSRPNGAFALLALDQRESLRAYLQETVSDAISDVSVIAFKESALRELGTAASGVLVDIDFGVAALLRVGRSLVRGGVILAADRLTQDGSGAIVATELDPRVGPTEVRSTECSALKLLVIWRPDANERKLRARLVNRFMRHCAEHAVLGLVEGLMDEATRARAREANGADLYYAMAEEMAAYEPHIYKTEVPGDPALAPSELAERSAILTERVACPWVLLSNGVPSEAFPAVVAAACEGGASGFLAGRAIWRLAISPRGYDDSTGVTRQRLAELTAIVDEKARPWQVALDKGTSPGGVS